MRTTRMTLVAARRWDRARRPVACPVAAGRAARDGRSAATAARRAPAALRCCRCRRRASRPPPDEYRLRRASDGSGDLVYEASGFYARVARDGAVRFRDRHVTNLQLLPFLPLAGRASRRADPARRCCAVWAAAGGAIRMRTAPPPSIRPDRERDAVAQHDLLALPARPARDLPLSEPLLRQRSGDAADRDRHAGHHRRADAPGARGSLSFPEGPLLDRDARDAHPHGGPRPRRGRRAQRRGAAAPAARRSPATRSLQRGRPARDHRGPARRAGRRDARGARAGRADSPLPRGLGPRRRRGSVLPAR